MTSSSPKTRTLSRVGIAIAVVVSLLSVGGSDQIRAAGTNVDEGWLVSWPTEFGYQGVRFRDVTEWNESVSTLRARYPELTTNWWKGCSTITSEPCSSAPRIEFSSVLQPCATAGQVDCVVDFGMIEPSGAKISATYKSRFPDQGLNDFPSHPTVGLPEGGPAGLWEMPASSGLSERTHLVRAVVSGDAKPGQKVTFQNFAANVSVVSMSTMPCRQGYEQEAGCRTGNLEDSGVNHGGEEGWWGYSDGYGQRDGFDCVLAGNFDSATQTADCATRKAMSKDVAYFLTVRLSQGVSGWMHGRLADPSITYDEFSQVPGAVSISISGKPISVPSIVIDKPFSELPPRLQESYRFNGGWPKTGGGYWDPSGGGWGEDPSDPLGRIRRSLPSSFGVDAISELEAWLPVVNDTAVADPTTWTIRSLGYDIGPQYGCPASKNRITGIVATNATVYRANTPEFDAATQTLNYTVAAPHYSSSGEVFRGAYTMIIRSDLARCIYKFSSAPLKGTVEVVDSGSEKIAAVTNVAEFGGWIKLSATGFTHSTPTIRTKLTQDVSRLQVAIGRSLTSEKILSSLGKRATKGSRVTLSVLGPTRGGCKVVGTGIKAISRGTCRIKVGITTNGRVDSSFVDIRVT